MKKIFFFALSALALCGMSACKSDVKNAETVNVISLESTEAEVEAIEESVATDSVSPEEQDAAPVRVSKSDSLR